MLTPFQCLFHPCVAAVARKRPWSFCQKCRWQVTPKHTETLDPVKAELADYAAKALVLKPIRKTSSHATCQESAHPQSSQVMEPLWTDPGLQSGFSVLKLTSTLKEKNFQIGNESSNLSSKVFHVRKKPPCCSVVSGHAHSTLYAACVCLTGCDDHGARGLAERQEHDGGEESILPVGCLCHGALGWTR